MGLVHLQRAGHTPIALVGGGTGLIGDPSGKSAERQLLSEAELQRNLEAVRAQLEHFLDFTTEANPARLVDNREWLAPMGVLDFLRDVGKHFSVNVLLQKESIRRRLEDSTSGISFTEFSYLLLQSYDFLELFKRYGCAVQMGGSDQWGNITAGIDLIRRVESGKAHGIVFPLVTATSGVKFGKTEEGTVWLDPRRTSPYRFFQFWMNTEDADAGRYLRFFTLMDRATIEGLDAAMVEEPGRRAAQRALAEEVTRRVHGEDGLARAERATEVLFGGSFDGLSWDEIEDVFHDVPSTDLLRDAFSGDGMAVIDLLTNAGAAASKGEARRAVEGGGAYLNNARIEDVQARVLADRAVEGRFLVLRMGKKRYHLVRLVEG
jgi:tyrosyl-tRNA synthetase